MGLLRVWGCGPHCGVVVKTIHVLVLLLGSPLKKISTFHPSLIPGLCSIASPSTRWKKWKYPEVMKEESSVRIWIFIQTSFRDGAD